MKIADKIARLGNEPNFGNSFGNDLGKELLALLQDPNVFIGRWESMESAPENGTPLLFTKDGGVEIGWLNWCPHVRKYYPSNEDADVLDPTAWAHLPTAPEVKE